MSEHLKIGHYGESLAKKYLKKKGYRIISANIKYSWGEIDIIAKDNNDVLVFIEVKTLKKIKEDYESLRPEDNLTYTKLSKLKKSCLFFANQNPKLISRGWRIDLIALTIIDKNCDIQHLENIG